ncbi:chemotaxis response regulator protein-glutamate methylesterase [Massilia sp. TS11]|uniref:protein-glutamate methylesterase/protein-glutamine glutaminase n=1 Tax=Massilia sp. TS11 TaxID=2908003 RepID=UPI001EDB0913|nr:chemotaxis response regulator protein-glutamate methylesterase [Massilia sp. TS11]MCG2582973.1 chemotaxis response regulator protein-glutamate methylesterase [Massilia sp. TS11]
MNPIKVLLVDDSAVVRQVLGAALAEDPQVRVLAAVANPLLALEPMKTCWPDVIVLDIEMPVMDGLSFLKKIMAERPTPVIICSTLTEAGARPTLAALAAGAVAAIAKPKSNLRELLHDTKTELLHAIRLAAASRPRVAPVARHPLETAAPGQRLVAIGASTGGTQALESVLAALPANAPGTVIVQHMPEKFTAAFAERLDSICAVHVREAGARQLVRRGEVLIAPGGRHLQIKRIGNNFWAETLDGPLVSRHKPSVDVLFRSVAQAAGARARGIILTGMGDDGAAGLLAMREAGADTIAQDEASCVVYGMPKEAVKKGAVARTLALGQIAAAICAA